MCKCNHGPAGDARAGRPGAASALGQQGMMLLAASGDERRPQWGEVTGTRYPFDERARMWVDRRDAIYLLGPELRMVT